MPLNYQHFQKHYRRYLALIAAILALVFVLQNSQNVPVSFLWMKGITSLATVLLWTLLAGFAVGLLLRKN